MKEICPQDWRVLLQSLLQLGRSADGALERDLISAIEAYADKRTSDVVVSWAALRWNCEVQNRPLENIHRRTLDDVWRQVIRRFGGDDIALCGPTHDELMK